MKTVLVYTTNERLKYFEGALGNLKCEIGWSATFDVLRGYLYTSVVEGITETENTVVLKTMNSIYVFEKFERVNDDN